MNTTPLTLTAEELVALAKRVAQIHLGAARVNLGSIPLVVYCYRDGHTRSAIGAPMVGDPDVVMSTALSRQNTASEDALVRALLASAIHVADYGDGRDPSFMASLADAHEAGWATADGARDALLDALLATTEVR